MMLSQHFNYFVWQGLKQKPSSGQPLDNTDAFFDEDATNGPRLEDPANFLDKELEILPENELKLAVTTYVEKEENQCIRDFVEQSLKTTQRHLLMETQSLEDDIHLMEDDTELENLVTKHKKQVWS